MRKPKLINNDEINKLKNLLKKSKTKSEFQHIQCILIRALFPGMTALEIANLVALSESSVWRIHSEYYHQGVEIISMDKRGGRYRENLTIEQETDLLKPFFQKAISSGVIVIKDVKLAYENLIGQSVADSTIYRMLDRHGWRKIVPYKRHPKSNKEAQESFKKTP